MTDEIIIPAVVRFDCRKVAPKHEIIREAGDMDNLTSIEKRDSINPNLPMLYIAFSVAWVDVKFAEILFVILCI